MIYTGIFLTDGESKEIAAIHDKAEALEMVQKIAAEKGLPPLPSGVYLFDRRLEIVY